jgi:hypothetical protein
MIYFREAKNSITAYSQGRKTETIGELFRNLPMQVIVVQNPTYG